MTRTVTDGVRRRTLAGKASDFIKPFDLPPGALVVLACRVSGRRQRGDTLTGQVAWVRYQIALRGVRAVEVVTHVGPGWDPWWLARAAAIAAEYGAVLVADSTDRFIRSPAYGGTAQNFQARPTDLEELSYWTEGVPLMTLLHPDATPAEVRAHQRRRGQWASGNKGGRPAAHAAGYKKQQREELLPRVVELHHAGLSGRQISADTGVPEATVRRWISEA